MLFRGYSVAIHIAKLATVRKARKGAAQGTEKTTHRKYRGRTEKGQKWHTKRTKRTEKRAKKCKIKGYSVPVPCFLVKKIRKKNARSIQTEVPTI